MTHALIRLIVKSEINIERFDIIAFFTFGIMAIIYTITGIIWLYNPLKTNYTITISSRIIHIVISGEEILAWILGSSFLFLLIFSVVGIILSIIWPKL